MTHTKDALRNLSIFKGLLFDRNCYLMLNIEQTLVNKFIYTFKVK